MLIPSIFWFYVNYLQPSGILMCFSFAVPIIAQIALGLHFGKHSNYQRVSELQ